MKSIVSAKTQENSTNIENSFRRLPTSTKKNPKTKEERN